MQHAFHTALRFAPMARWRPLPSIRRYAFKIAGCLLVIWLLTAHVGLSPIAACAITAFGAVLSRIVSQIEDSRQK